MNLGLINAHINFVKVLEKQFLENRQNLETSLINSFKTTQNLAQKLESLSSLKEVIPIKKNKQINKKIEHFKK
jgi:hypothetical protein